MSVEVKPQFILITDVINGYLVKEKYIGYTINEAKRKFKLKYKQLWIAKIRSYEKDKNNYERHMGCYEAQCV